MLRSKDANDGKELQGAVGPSLNADTLLRESLQISSRVFRRNPSRRARLQIDPEVRQVVEKAAISFTVGLSRGWSPVRSFRLEVVATHEFIPEGLVGRRPLFESQTRLCRIDLTVGHVICLRLPCAYFWPEQWLRYGRERTDRKSTRLNSSHVSESRMPSSA